jgi:hypothetical protein
VRKQEVERKGKEEGQREEEERDIGRKGNREKGRD